MCHHHASLRRTGIAATVAAIDLCVTASAAAAQAPSVNSGFLGSTCEEESAGIVFSEPPAGTRSYLDPRRGPLPTARAPYEISGPTGRYAHKPPKGIVVILHGGGWVYSGPGPMTLSRPNADRWRRYGYITVSATYRGCDRSLPDVLALYDSVRRIAPQMPICVAGSSAGGHLALMVAVRRADVACVVALGSPTDLTAQGMRPAYEPTTGTLSQLDGPRLINGLATAAFGAGALTRVSPALQIRASSTRFLLATAERDMLVPCGQLDAFAGAARERGVRVRTQCLSAGPAEFVHAYVSEQALDTLHSAEWRLAKRVATRRNP